MSVQSLAAGVLADGRFLDSADKVTTVGSFLAHSFSPFQTSAAVPFASKDRREDVVAVISNSTTGGGTLNLTINLTTEDSPATPLDFSISTNARATSFASIVGQGTQDSSSICFKPPANSSSLRRDARQLAANAPDRQASSALTLQQSLSMQSLSMRLSLPSFHSGATSEPQTSRTPSVALSIGARTTSRALCAATAVHPATAANAVGGPFTRASASSAGDASDTQTRTTNSCSGGAQSATVTISGTAHFPQLDPHCDSASGDERSPPRLIPHLHAAESFSPRSLMTAHGSAGMQLDLPNFRPLPLLGLPGMRKEGFGRPTAGAGTCGDSIGSDGCAPAGPHPADKFLRFLDLETCLSEMRDLSFIGSGASGFVYSGMWCGMPVAVKFMLSGDTGQLQRQQREAALSRLASHPHLVQTYAVAAAQLAPSSFQADPALRRMSGLSHADLFSTCAGGAMVADLYGTASLSPAPSATAVPGASPSLSPRRSGTQAATASSSVPSGGGACPRQSCDYDRQYTCAGPFRSPFAGHGPCISGEQPAVVAAACASGAAGAPPLNQAPRHTPGGVQQLLMRQQLRNRLSGNIPATGSGACSMPNTTVEDAVVEGHPGGRPSPSAAGRHGNTSAAGAGTPGSSQRPPGHGVRAPRQQQASNAGGGAATSPAGQPNTAFATSISTVDIEVSATFQVDAKADSFEMGASEGTGLMLFQPSDVLTHIGARPGQWLTVVIMEEMDRGSLHRTIHGGVFNPVNSSLSKRHRVRGMVRTLLEVAQGMAHLHSAGLVHGDLKPANVLLKANVRDLRGFIAKVSDFGVTRALAEGATQTTVSTSDWGTVIYTAPEVFNGKAGMPSDVFSFGALIWHLTTGQLPHEDINPFAVVLAVSRGELDLDWPASVPKPLRKLGRLCMQHNPAERPTFSEIARALRKLEARMRACSTLSSMSAVYHHSTTHGSSNGGSQSTSLPGTPRAAAPVGSSRFMTDANSSGLSSGGGGTAPVVISLDMP